MVIGALVTPVIRPPADACSTPTGMARSSATNPSARLPSTTSPTRVCHISGHCVTVCSWPCSPPSPLAARANGERGPGRAVPADSRAWARCVPAPGRQTITARSHRVLGGRVGGVVRHGRFLTSFTGWAWRHCRRTRWGPWTSRSAGAPVGVAGASDGAEPLPGGDVLTGHDLALREVAVGMDVPVGRGQPDPLAVAPPLPFDQVMEPALTATTRGAPVAAAKSWPVCLP